MLRRGFVPLLVGMLLLAQRAHADIAPPPDPIYEGPPYATVFAVAFLVALCARVLLLFIRGGHKGSAPVPAGQTKGGVVGSQSVDEPPSRD